MKEVIISVGIDIGTTTTQLIFSKITLENTASTFSIPRIEINNKEVIYKSKIYFTPFIDEVTLDILKIREIIEGEYIHAGFTPENIKTGAVIITGEAARKGNASLVLKSLSDLAGDFVVATAGPDLEAIIAGKGSGAEQISKDLKCVTVNIDIGGGTTNIAVFENGEVIDTCCLNIGGRLVRINKELMVIEYIQPMVKKIMEKFNISIKENEKVSINKLTDLCNILTDALKEVLGIKEKSHILEYFLTEKDLKRDYKIEYVLFSGGVADYIYDFVEENIINKYEYGDIGIVLGSIIKNSDIMKKFRILKPIETVRATVVGAGSHTMEISGSTITYTKDVFPIKNIPILKVAYKEEIEGKEVIKNSIKNKIEWYKIEGGLQLFALGLKGIKNPKFIEVVDIANCIIDGIGNNINELEYLIVVLENDMAKALGQTLYSLLNKNKDVICIDNIKVENGDYIDIGKPLGAGRVVPVVIKTLVFNF